MSIKKLVFPEIPVKFIDGRVPKGFVNGVKNWNFTRLEVEDAHKNGKLLTLDIDLAGQGSCGLGCGHCFRRNMGFFSEKRFGSGELEAHLLQAREIGLKSVKIIGPGEPLEERGLLGFLRFLHDNGIAACMFTKAHPLADDGFCMRTHGMDGPSMIAELKRLDVSMLAGFTSMDAGLEDALVRKPGFHAARQKAVERLAAAGFNDFVPGEPTRLCFVFNPLTPANLDEAFEVYRYVRERNIQPVMAPTMVAGRARDRLAELCPAEDALLELYVKVNVYAIEHGIYSLEELGEDGVAAYAGGAPCNQVAVGMFMRGDGTVLRCPGDDYTVQGNIREKDLKRIWEESENRRVYAGRYNNECPPKEGITFPEGFFGKVLERVERHFGNKAQ